MIVKKIDTFDRGPKICLVEATPDGPVGSINWRIQNEYELKYAPPTDSIHSPLFIILNQIKKPLFEVWLPDFRIKSPELCFQKLNKNMYYFIVVVWIKVTNNRRAITW